MVHNEMNFQEGHAVLPIFPRDVPSIANIIHWLKLIVDWNTSIFIKQKEKS